MRLTKEFLRCKSNESLKTLSVLDISNLSLSLLENLGCCPNLEVLTARGNNLEEIPDLSCCPNLWKLDLSNNKLRSLDGLQKFVAIGTLILSYNSLEWIQLNNIRHLHILSLSLHGNDDIENDPNYRLHVIDSLPHLWMLDGRVITATERLQVEYFFRESALSDRPIRHKLPKENFVPTSQQNQAYGVRAVHLLRRFPALPSLNTGYDIRQLEYLAYNIQQHLRVENEYKNEKLAILQTNPDFLEAVLKAHDTNPEQGNLLLLLLLGSLEFALPAALVEKTLTLAQLENMGSVNVMDLFYLPRDIRCHVAIILLSALKLDRDRKRGEAVHEKLYSCLYHIVGDVVRLQNADRMYKKVPNVSPKKRNRCPKAMLAAEVVQLMCLVPEFYSYLPCDLGVINLVSNAIGGLRCFNDLNNTVAKLSQVSEPNYSEIALHLTKTVQKHSNKLFTRFGLNTTDAHLLSRALPKRPKTSPIYTAEYLTTGRHTPIQKREIVDPKLLNQKPPKDPALGDQVLLGPLSISKIIALPDPKIALVQIDNVQESNGSMVSYIKKDGDRHYAYVNLSLMKWDHQNMYWRPIGSVGDKITFSEEVPVPESETSTEVGRAPAPKNSPRLLEKPKKDNEDVPGIPRPLSAALHEKYIRNTLVREPQARASTPSDGIRITSQNQNAEEVLNQDATTLYDCLQNAMENVKIKKTVQVSNINLDFPDTDGQGAKVLVSARPHTSKKVVPKPPKPKEEPKPEEPKVNIEPEKEKSPSEENTIQDPTERISVVEINISEKTPLSQNSTRKERPIHIKTEEVKEADNSGDFQGNISIQVPQMSTGTTHPHIDEDKSPQISCQVCNKKVEKVHKKTRFQTPRPMSAIDAYTYIMQKIRKQEEESMYKTSYQNQRTEQWRRSSVELEDQDEEPRTTTVHDSRGSFTIQQTNKWLAGGKDIYHQVWGKRHSEHIPGWKQDMVMRPKSALSPRRMPVPTVNLNNQLDPAHPSDFLETPPRKPSEKRNATSNSISSLRRPLPRQSIGVVCVECQRREL